MRIMSVNTLRRFALNNPHISGSIESWIFSVQKANWATPHDVKQGFGSASILQNGRIVFNIHGNKVRLITAVLFQAKSVLIKFIGFHSEYDQVDALTVDQKKWRQKNEH
jgi:mRNA interferase HigB